MSSLEKKTELPKSIGMSLSGGGFRAAGFHLGAMSCLQRVGWLSRVKMLSTVSGGTFTGARYAISLTENQSFSEFFKQYYEELEDTSLITCALQAIGSGTAPNIPSGRRNFITSMAQTYAEKLFNNQRTQQPYQFKDILDGNTAPLSEITFNATDFRTGLAFRFQKSRRGLIGNYYLALPRAAAGKIRLADIVAASSCFPGGFEPMQFPQDFGWPENEVPDDIRKIFAESKYPNASIAMMDGGVYDNQGLDSLLLADGRQDPKQKAVAEEAESLDVVIASDTDREFPDLYPYPAPARQSGTFWLRVLLMWNPSLRVINYCARGLQLLCFLTVIAVIVNLVLSKLTWDAAGIVWALFAYGIPLVLAGLLFLILALIRNQVKYALLPKIPTVGAATWHQLKHIKLDQLIDMISLRVGSLVALTSLIFMKRIRQLGYRIFYDRDKYDHVQIANYVYHLDPGRPWFFTDSRAIADLPPGLIAYLAKIKPPGVSLQEIAGYATAMETTLWFKNRCELSTLVAAGQATMCFNLMKYIVRNYRFDDSKQTFVGEIQPVWQQLLDDWNQLADTPYVLLEKDLNRTRFPAPNECNP